MKILIDKLDKEIETLRFAHSALFKTTLRLNHKIEKLAEYLSLHWIYLDGHEAKRGEWRGKKKKN